MKLHHRQGSGQGTFSGKKGKQLVKAKYRRERVGKVSLTDSEVIEALDFLKEFSKRC